MIVPAWLDEDEILEELAEESEFPSSSPPPEHPTKAIAIVAPNNNLKLAKRISFPGFYECNVILAITTKA